GSDFCAAAPNYRGSGVHLPEMFIARSESCSSYLRLGSTVAQNVRVFLLFGRTKRPDLHRNSPPAFFAAFRWQLGARCSLDRCDNSRAAGYALIVPSRPIRFWLLILSL